MADWSGNKEALSGSENAGNLDALIEYLVSRANHPGAEFDAAKVQQGKQVALEGAWAGDLNGTSCVDCHSTMGEDFAEDTAAEGDGYPSLAQYGSAAWLKAFIRHPESSQFYDSKNQMPSFADKMSNKELDLLVEWLTGDYHATKVERYTNKAADVAKAMGERSAAGADKDQE